MTNQGDADKVREPSEDLLKQVKADQGKAFAIKKVAGVLVPAAQNVTEIIDSIAERAFGTAQEIRRDLRHWFAFPKDINSWSEQFMNVCETFEVPIKVALFILLAVISVLALRCILEMLLDTVDICAYCHEEHEKDEV